MSDPIELAAIERGAGTPVALVHGGVFHSGPAWAKSLLPLAESDLRAIAVDRRGHGRSQPGDADHIPVHLHADDLRLTLELRDASPAHLVGVSYGALVCLDYALSWPERVISMVLVEPPLFTWTEDEPDMAVWFEKFAEVRAEAAQGAALEEWVPRWLSLIDSEMAASITPDSASWSLIERHAPLIFKEEAGWEYRPDIDRIRTLALPALVLNGDRSEPPMQFIGEALAAELPMGQHQWVSGAGHVLHSTQPDVFNDLLIDFILSNDPGI